MLNGKILVVSPKYLFFSRGLSIYRLNRTTQAVENFVKLPSPFFQRISSKMHILSRLLRSQVHHMISDGGDGFYVVYGKSLLRLNRDGKVVGCRVGLVGSRPLCVIQYRGALLYGEYSANNERSSMGLYSYDGFTTKEVLRVPSIRHIHGIFYDVFNDSIYVTTGDYGKEAGIWRLDLDNVKLELITGGSQQERAVQLIFCDRYIYYGTDTPTEANFIYRIDKESNERECLGSAKSSIFYGAKVSGEVYFSTVAEPSDCNTMISVDLLHIGDSGIEVDQSFKKDRWPMKYFQYGQLMFPYYVDSDRESELWIYKQGVYGSGISISVRVK